MMVAKALTVGELVAKLSKLPQGKKVTLFCGGSIYPCLDAEEVYDGGVDITGGWEAIPESEEGTGDD